MSVCLAEIAMWPLSNAALFDAREKGVGVELGVLSLSCLMSVPTVQKYRAVIEDVELKLT